MLKIEDGCIYINRGDDASFTVSIRDDGGAAYVLQAGDTLTLTVRETPEEASEALLSVTSGTDTLTLPHSKTALIEAGRYSADIQLTKQNGDRITVFPELETHGSARNWKNFVVDGEVTVI